MTENNGLKQKIYEWTAKYANKAGQRHNPDKEALDYILDELAVKLEKFAGTTVPAG